MDEQTDISSSFAEARTPIPHICQNVASCHVENFFHMKDCHVEKFQHMTNCQLEKSLHIVNKEKNYVMWRNLEQNLSCWDISPHNKCGDKSLLSPFMLFCREICFVAIYAVLPQNLFCHNLCTFVWRRIYWEIVHVEKKDKYEVCAHSQTLIFGACW